MHQQSYGFRKDNDPVEIVSLRLSVVGKTDHADLYALGEKGNGAPEPVAVRPAYFSRKWMQAKVFDRGSLKVGDQFEGPAIIEEHGATSVIGPGDRLTVDERRNLIVDVAGHEAYRAAVDAAE